jgi:hypothetical protein
MGREPFPERLEAMETPDPFCIYADVPVLTVTP